MQLQAFELRKMYYIFIARLVAIAKIHRCVIYTGPELLVRAINCMFNFS